MSYENPAALRPTDPLLSQCVHGHDRAGTDRHAERRLCATYGPVSVPLEAAQIAQIWSPSHAHACEAGALAFSVQMARLARVDSVSGCSAPKTRSRTGSRAAYWSRAAAASPASPVQRASSARKTSASGCSAPKTRSLMGTRAAYWSRAAAASPACPVQRAMFERTDSAKECSAPATRSPTGSRAAYWSRAATASPACPLQ
jgi:hypothetical protein